MHHIKEIDKMAKGKRKRSNKKKADTSAPNNKVKPINQMEVQFFQQLINISNQYGKLKQQINEYEVVLKSLKDKRKKIQKGEIELPIMFPLGKKSFYTCNDKKEALKELDGEIKVVANAVKGIQGQVDNGADEYVAAAFRLMDLLDNKYSRFRPKNVYSKGCNPNQKEKVLFEKELDELASNEESKKKMKKALNKAKKENKKMKEE